MRAPRNLDLSGIFLRTAIAMVLIVVATAAFVTEVVSKQALEFQKSIEHKLVLRGADAVALSFNTALTREWDSLHAVAKSIGSASQEDMNKFMDAVAQTGGQVAWAGFASLDGTIKSGSNRLQEGTNISAKQWFRDGLRRPSIETITEAGTVENERTGELERYLNLSTPVIGPHGQTMGVLVYRLRIEWVRSFLLKASSDLGVDVVIQDVNGDFVIDTRHTVKPIPENLTASASLRSNSSGAFHLVGDTNGDTYAYAPNFVWKSLPAFGWRVFAVLRQDNMSNDLPVLTEVTLSTVAVAALGMLIVTLVFLKLLLRPVERLAKTAESIANGNRVFPEETTSSREAASLSSALAIIQSRLMPRKRRLHPTSGSA
jgi:HAMP domain.